MVFVAVGVFAALLAIVLVVAKRGGTFPTEEELPPPDPPLPPDTDPPTPPVDEPPGDVEPPELEHESGEGL